MSSFNLIAAVSLNGVIGDSATNSIPWFLPSDLKYFKQVTLEQTVVMGSRTFHSIGKPLPKRRNVVITRNALEGRRMLNEYHIDETYESFAEAAKYERGDFFVIGGQHIYGEALRFYPHKLYITIVKREIEGDVRFPIEGRRFLDDVVHVSDTVKYHCVKRSEWMSENDIDFQFTIFQHATS